MDNDRIPQEEAALVDELIEALAEHGIEDAAGWVREAISPPQ